MCGFGGSASVFRQARATLQDELSCWSGHLRHRGPDSEGSWTNISQSVALAHSRLSIINVANSGAQPMSAPNGTTIVFNGEIYNYRELRHSMATRWRFSSASDTECILAAYDKDGTDCLQGLRGMFAFAIWDERRQLLFAARDRFGIKPFYYIVVGDVFYFASEAKALLPFVMTIQTNEQALAEYLTFQYTLGEQTLFEGIKQLLPGHALVLEGGRVRVWQYWDVSYEIDHGQSANDVVHRIRDLMEDSVEVHGRSDVPIGAYISGGIDSSLISRLAMDLPMNARLGFHGRFADPAGYDESSYAMRAAAAAGAELHVVDITAADFSANISKVIRSLDFPVAGPGSFAQYMVSKLASEHVKVVLGGQGGDELFGGYARYLVAYLEQSLKAAIDGSYRNGNYVVTIESIVPNLGLLREYQPLLRKFWENGLFGPMDERYFRLIDRSVDMRDEIDWAALDSDKVFESFTDIFNSSHNVQKEAYFDRMTHFDFKTLLPALLHVEDRMSMAHGIESRVPFLDHPLVEFAATVPADIKFEGGKMKHLLREAFAPEIPQQILDRRDKMGFPVPLSEWFSGELRDFSQDILHSLAHNGRPFINGDVIARNRASDQPFSRRTWGLISLELWYQEFHDRASEWRGTVGR